MLNTPPQQNVYSANYNEVAPIASVIAPQISLQIGVVTITLPYILIAGIPVGFKVIQAKAMFLFRSLDNTFALTNSLNGAQYIQCNKDVGGSLINAYDFVGGEFSVPASTSGASGDALLGTNDISAQVPANGEQMDFQWTLSQAVKSNLNFNDFQIILRLWVGL